MIRARDSNLRGAVAEARMIEVQTAVGGGQHDTASVEPERPQRHHALIAGLKQASPPVIPRFCGQHVLNALHPWPVLLGRMERRGDRLRGAQMRLHLGRPARVDQARDGVQRKPRLKDEPDVLTQSESRNIRCFCGHELETRRGFCPPVVPHHGSRPRGQPEKVPPVR